MKENEELLTFKSREIKAEFTEFKLPENVKKDNSIIVPAVKGIPFFKYGIHYYSFYNFKSLKGISVSIRHKDIMRLTLKKLGKAEWNKNSSIFSNFFKRYHYNFSFLEQIMLMTVPHTVTPIDNGRFFVNLWAYFGYLDINCIKRTVTYKLIDDEKYRNVLGSQQFYDKKNKDIYYASYSLGESFDRIKHKDRPVKCNIYKENIKDKTNQIIWSGDFTDYVHDIIINKNRTYCIIPELGSYTDKENNIIPSKVLILNLKTKKTWTLNRFAVAAHAQFDPDNPEIVYFSNHNFSFEHTGLIKLLKKATYSIKFRGPASVYKYKLTPDGPKEIGVFTRADFYRLTNFHIFKHRGKKVLAALGFPDVIFMIDAENMSFIKKIKIETPRMLRNFFLKKEALIGTFSPSIDGEKFYVQTTKSFQVVDIDSGQPDMITNHYYNRTCSNHMQTSSDVKW